jgi:hypothetical protein
VVSSCFGFGLRFWSAMEPSPHIRRSIKCTDSL